MSFQPVLPISGYAGWVFLNRTLESQQTAHANSADQRRDVEYFSDRIGSVRSADDLVSDRRLLKVALGAFGLDNDIDNRFFIRKVLEEGTSEKTALANRLADKSYKEFSEAFGFGNGTLPRTGLAGFAGQIVSAYQERQFEIAVGDQDEDLRLALTAQRELADIAGSDASEDTKWYRILGSEPLRAVMETALGLPEAIGQLDLERQLGMFREKADRAFGADDISQFAVSENLDNLIKTFLLRAQIADGSGTMSSNSIALSVLSSGVS
ncbi:DUF1217 domain-containing protein [Tropicimonas sp.]|uniref:DUF1217 domain-containing protein n=1 Tax=Tropicimonas sp. TaxID=2067044 RepID=UPI003A8BEAB7